MVVRRVPGRSIVGQVGLCGLLLLKPFEEQAVCAFCAPGEGCLTRLHYTPPPKKEGEENEREAVAASVGPKLGENKDDL